VQVDARRELALGRVWWADEGVGADGCCVAWRWGGDAPWAEGALFAIFFVGGWRGVLVEGWGFFFGGEAYGVLVQTW
jgi:hypothetical protein